MTRTLRVLVVDDEPAIAAAHAEYVRRIPGFDVCGTVGTLAGGLQHIAASARTGRPVDLVLADVGLPDGSGLDLAAAVAEFTPRPDIIVITSARDIETVRSAVASGAMLYLIKPFAFAAFAEKLDRYRAFREVLDGADVGQREVDAALAVLHEPPSAATTPKGLAPSTLEAVTAVLRAADAALGASEVATRIGVSRVTAWRYLERLADDRLCERATEYGGRGRPEVRYRWISAR